MSPDRGWLSFLGLIVAGTSVYHFTTGFRDQKGKNVAAGSLEAVVALTLFRQAKR